jgi:diazepam-binding inhibitor (GABA receptor modulator, acyl-CoA-binding protein)
MELQQQFEAAKELTKTFTEKPDNETLLKLYSLYKQGAEGDINIEEPSNMFDFVGKAKYNAWNALKGTSKESAMQSYINLVNELTLSN